MNAMLGHMARDMTDIGDKWCILRCSGASTLKLARSLSAHGIEAWAPERTSTKRKGKARLRVEYPAPILPTFVFARAAHAVELQIILARPLNLHPAFSIMRGRHRNRFPMILDSSLLPLRAEEERAKRAVLKRTRRTIPIGSAFTPTEGAFAGLTGIVESSDGKSAMVSFGGNFRVNIAAWLLPDDKLESGLSTKDLASAEA